MTLRWYGSSFDTVTLKQIRQIPGVTGVITTLYDTAPGEVWSRERIHAMKEEVEANGLHVSGIESVNVHDAIKIGNKDRDLYINNYIETLENLGKEDIHLVCYNFMPVFDWTRTELARKHPDGSTVLAYTQAAVDALNPEDMFHSIASDTNGSIMPVCDKYDINMAIHPDDPAWSVFGLPRIIINKKNILRMMKMVDNPHNGVTFCSGSYGTNLENDLSDMIRSLKGRIHFAHVRNLKFNSPSDFEEAAHLSSDGSFDMYEIMKALYDIDFQGPIRPDHGRMIWDEVAMPGFGGYLNFLVVFVTLCVFSPATALIALGAAAVSFCFLLVISSYSAKNAPVEAKANRDMTGAVLEYARGLSVVKSFGQSGASMEAFSEAVADSRKIHLKIEWGFIPANSLHLLALKCGSVALALAAFFMGMNGRMTFSMMLIFVFYSFEIFASVEPISDSAHVLSVIEDAMDQLDALKAEHYIDSDGKDIPLEHHDILFKNVDFGYTDRKVLKNVSFTIPEKTSTAIVGPSGSGKTTICALLARFYGVDGGSIQVGGHDIREMTCDSLLFNISMVFQNVYLFHDTIRANICFGKPDATEEEMIAASKKACCHDFIMNLPDRYDTVLGEGGNTLSGGQKQRISIARAILKDSPIIILDEATASVDPENEHLIQNAITELTRGKTIITIAHRLSTIERADQILVVADGQIAECGTHEELIRKEGKYQQFVKIREKAEGWKLS